AGDPPRRRPTINDVAAASGVSRGTVSRYLNGGKWVSPDAQESIQRAIRRTGYRANQHARSLVTGRANALAFLLAEPQDRLFADPTYTPLLRGAAEALTKRQMTLNLLVASTPEERENVVAYMSGGHVDGAMLISSHENDPLVDLLLAHDIPVVSCGLPLGRTDAVPSVSVDEAGGARAMVAHLRSRGRRRIAMITGPLDQPGGRYRLQGFREELGADYDEMLVAHGDWGRESGAVRSPARWARPVGGTGYRASGRGSAPTTTGCWWPTAAGAGSPARWRWLTCCSGTVRSTRCSPPPMRWPPGRWPRCGVRAG